MASMAGALNPTGAIASAAKKKLLGSKESKSDSAAAAAPTKPRCLTQEQYAAEAKAQQSAAIKDAAAAAFTATPVGMAVVGARAAAPVAGKVTGALSSRFRRGPNKESMTQALATGRLEVEKVSFDRGVDAPNSGSDKSLSVLVEILKEATGQYVVRVTPESDGSKAADPALARRRAETIVAKLVAGGVPSQRISAAPLTVATSWDSGPPKKSDAKLEIIGPPAAPKQ
jgi:outer membrane protein OmpA-like peptidoglycan-associated protein